MKKLSYATLKENDYKGYLLQNAPERVLQFGEGNFLRAFVDYFIDIANEKCNFNAKAVLCQPIENGLADMLNEQEGLYTLYLRGYENGQSVSKKRVISAVSRCINPYKGYDELLACAKNPDLRYITSNTTEAGIVFDANCKFDDAPPSAFPAKLTRFLYERYLQFGKQTNKGFIILSCELIDANGLELKKCVHEYISLWKLEGEFAAWIDNENLFCSTLVDRIVTGYPRAEAQALNEENGYVDNLLDTGEVFGFWVIEGPDWLQKELPFEKAGLPVLVTEDHTPYKMRKVRILNGAHTAMVPAAYLAGQSIVRGCMEDKVISTFMNKAVYEEIIPTLTLPEKELTDFAKAVGERFNNPFIDHALLSIALNCTSKWKARVLPSLEGYISEFGKLPPCLTFSLAAYIAFYRQENGKNANDDQWVLDFYTAHKNDTTQKLVQAVLTNQKMWGKNLDEINGLTSAVCADLEAIDKNGVYDTMQSLACK